MKNLENNIANLVQDIEDGNFNPLEGYANLKVFEKFVKDAINQIEPLALEEAGNYNEKTFSEFGFQITKRNGYVSYDFSSNEDVLRLEAELKARKEVLKNASKMGKSIIDEDTGEIYEPCPVKGGTKDTLSIKKID